MAAVWVLVASAATSAEIAHRKSELGPVDIGLEPRQATKESVQMIGRIIDTVKSETPDGCRVGLAITNTPSSAQLHVVVDGKRVPGFDDVAWHTLVLSPGGKHYAFVANVAGKQVCVLDGVPGKPYEKIGRNGTDNGALYFSPDGRRLGYAALAEGRWCIVFDGKEGPGFDEVSSSMVTRYRKILRNGFPAWETQRTAGGGLPQYSDDGARVFYVAQRRNGNASSYWMVIDGQPGSELSGCGEVHVLPNGKLAYAAMTGSTWQFVVDGVMEPPGGGSGLVLSADGEHYGYLTGRPGETRLAVIDGKPRADLEIADHLEISPDGQHYGLVTYQEGIGNRAVLDGNLLAPVNGFHPARVLFGREGGKIAFIGQGGRNRWDQAIISEGKIVAQSPVSTLVFVSADLKRVAFARRLPNGKQRMAVDGVEGPETGDIGPGDFKFSDDGRHFGYVATEPGYGQRVIMDALVGPVYDDIARGHPLFSPNGEHFVYAARAGRSWMVVTDGKAGLEVAELDPTRIQFTPDGHTLYPAKIGDLQAVVFDDRAAPGFTEVEPGLVRLSPDGRRFAYVGLRKFRDDSDRPAFYFQAVIDGIASEQYVGIGEGGVKFTPDSRHAFYVAKTGRVQRVVVDGVAGPDFLEVIAGPTLRADGRLEYLAFEGKPERPTLVRVLVDGFADAGPTPKR